VECTDCKSPYVSGIEAINDTSFHTDRVLDNNDCICSDGRLDIIVNGDKI